MSQYPPLNTSKQVVVTCNEPIVKGAKITVVNIGAGKVVSTSAMKTVVTPLRTKLTTGNYVVKVENGATVVTEYVNVNL